MQSVLLEISRKIKKEMKDLSSDDRDSVLRDAVEAVKRFNWTTVMMEYEKNDANTYDTFKATCSKANRA